MRFFWRLLLFRSKLLFPASTDRVEGSDSSSKPELEQAYRILAEEAFQRCLELAKIKNCYEHVLAQKDLPYPQAGLLQPELAMVYYNAIWPIFEELKAMPLAFHFVFALILDNTTFPDYPKEMPERINKQESYKEALIETIKNLWFFTKGLFYGINELAKNISEHASTKQGIIILRAYGYHYIDAQKEDDQYKIKHFHNSLDLDVRDHMKCLIDVNVLDLGDKGVVPTLIIKTSETINRIENNALIAMSREGLSLVQNLNDDIEMLKSKGTGISCLLSTKRITLNQQQKRSLAHIGLMSLAALVRKNSGEVVASSTKENDGVTTRDSYSHDLLKRLLYSMPTTGTCYNILLPVIEGKSYQPLIYSEINTNRELALGDIQAFDKLIKLDPATNKETVSLNAQKDSVFHILSITPTEKEGRAAEEEILTDVYRQIHELQLNETKSAACLDFDQIIGASFTASQLFRIVSTLELFYPSLHFVLFNISNELVNELVLLNKLYCEQNPNLDFWNRNKSTIFINFVESEGKRFYFTDVMWGATKSDFYALNRIVNNIHFNSISLNPSNKEDDQQNPPPNLPDLSSHPAFINQHVMLPIDLLLESGSKTLFEHNASFLLQNDFISKFNGEQVNLTQLILNKPGFKICDTHFKIGAKLHVTDFYYAKRIFQNSFYASRFAFLLAKKINNLINNGSCSKDDFTLIGYGLYSELLVSLTKKFLLSILSNSGRKKLAQHISDDLIEEDKEELKLIKSSEVLSENFVIIVPIASTFTTGFKIEHALAEIISKKCSSNNGSIHTEESKTAYLNVLLACDWDNKELQHSFGWENVEEQARVVKIRNTNDDSVSEQHYLLRVSTKWYSPIGKNRCQLCYPSDPSKEKALFSTDKTSVTPALIFGLPKVRHIDKQPYTLTLIDKHIYYGHHTRNHAHFLYSIKIDPFLEANIDAVKIWLGNLYEQNKLASKTDKVILISDCHHTNIRFINLVNEIVFLSSSTILHFDSKSDYIDNFSHVYSNILQEADKIYFVDDSLKSGSTFDRIHNFIFQAKDQLAEGKNARVINGCITLLNKMQPKDAAKVKSKLINNPQNAQLIDSFAHFHLFSSVDSSLPPPLEYEQKRYGNLAERSLLDRFAEHFNNQQKKVSPGSKSLDSHHIPRTEMLWATHCIYDLFSKIDNDSQITFENTFENWNNFIKHLKGKPEALTSKEAILKVLTQSPFTQYKPVRERVFFWISGALTKHLESLKEKINQEGASISSSDIRNLKFYIRRACTLDSSRLLHESMLEAILDIVDQEIEDIPPENPSSATQHKQLTITDVIPPGNTNTLTSLKHVKAGIIDSPNEFCYFYVAQVMELMDRDSTRSINVEHYLGKKLQSYDRLGRYAQKIVRLLYFENAQFINTSLDIIIHNTNFSDIYDQDKKKETINTDLEKIKEVIKQNPTITKSLRFKNLELFLENNPLSDNRYLSYLWVRALLVNDKRSGLLEQKTEGIMEKMMTFFYPDDGFISKNCRMGAFFSVHSVFKRIKESVGPWTIYDNGVNSGGIVRTHDWQASELRELDKLTEIIEEKIKNPKTVFVYARSHKVKWTNWEDSLTSAPLPIDQGPFSFLPKNSDLLIIIYIRKSGVNKPQAVLGFYSDPKPDDDFSASTMKAIDWLQAIRYILLLRKPLSRFIETHHENHEFLELKEAQARQGTVKLMGHGHDTIHRLVNSQASLNFIKTLPEKISGLISIFSIPINVGKERELISNHLARLFDRQESLTIEKICARYFELAQIIVESKDIETDKTDIKVFDVDDTETTPGANFTFDFAILDLIMVELLVNAKKNRWLFIPEEDKSRGNYIKLRFSIFEKNHKKGLHITLESTGPGFAPNIRNILNRGAKAKESGAISGLWLIRYIFDNFLIKHNEDVCLYENLKFKDLDREGSDMKIVTVTFTLESNRNGHKDSYN